jgi:hypothetical protein
MEENAFAKKWRRSTVHVTVLEAEMKKEPESGYKGRVLIEVEGHKQPYEVALLSKNGTMWDYSLSFARESGSEEQITAVEAALEEDDDLFDLLIDTAMDNLAE